MSLHASVHVVLVNFDKTVHHTGTSLQRFFVC